MEESAPVPVSFSSLGLSEPLLRAVTELGYTEATPVQALTIPAGLAGGDLVGISQTGSGKTAAFMLPALQQIDPKERRVQVLALCPTRELAVQVAGETEKLAKFLGRVRTTAVYGGASIREQSDMLAAGSHIVVGTPGRLLDHLRRGTLDLTHVKIAVLDEADKMLDMGFREEIEQVMQALPAERQTLFFSATMAPQIDRLITTYGRDPQRLTVENKSRTVDAIDQQFFDIHWRSRMEVLCRLLDIHDLRRGIIFANRKVDVDDLTEALLEKGYAADRLHGDMTQMLRDRVMTRFRNGALHLLVATDVAARGIDIKDIDVVFNFELPDDPEDYVHRIGRTGRAGRSGLAFSFVCGRKDAMRLRNAERYARVRIPRVLPPTPQEVEEKRSADHAAHVLACVEETAAGTAPVPDTAWLAPLLEAGHDLRTVAGVLFSMLRQSNAHECEPIPEDERRPVVQRKPRAEPIIPPPSADRPAARPRSVKESAAPAPAPAVREYRKETPAELPEKKRRTAPAHDIEPEAPAAAERPSRKRSATEEIGPFIVERPERAARAPRGRGKPVAGILAINVGTNDGASPREIAGMIYRTTGLEPGLVGTIEVRDRQTMAEVPVEEIGEIARRVSKTTWRGRKVIAKPAPTD